MTAGPPGSQCFRSFVHEHAGITPAQVLHVLQRRCTLAVHVRRKRYRAFARVAIEVCIGSGNGMNRQESVKILGTIKAPRQSHTSRASRTVRGMRGVTLIELMIAVVIVAVLAAIALPSYLGQLRRSARAEAQTVLTDMASRQQQFLVDRRAYAASSATLGIAPPGSLTGKFNFAVTAANGSPPTFTLTATGLGGQLQDACPVLSIDNAGNRLPADCW